jgi:uncharacterized protein (UPF0147 family)
LKKKKEQESEEKIRAIIETIEALENDALVPKNLKAKLQKTIDILREGCEASIKVNKALNELDEIPDYTNIEPHVRTQIWNIVSLLEAI